MGANIPQSEAELRALTAALTQDAALPPLIAIDQEGGDVSRLPWDDSLGRHSQGSAADAPATRSPGAAALVCAPVGVNFGIVADVTDDPGMFIYRRALGTTPDAGADRVAAAVEGERESTHSRRSSTSRVTAPHRATRTPASRPPDVEGHGARPTRCRSRRASTRARSC